jgi:ribosomal protein L31
MYVPDNEDIRQYLVDEEERIERLQKRFEKELEEKEDE